MPIRLRMPAIVSPVSSVATAAPTPMSAYSGPAMISTSSRVAPTRRPQWASGGIPVPGMPGAGIPGGG